MTVRLGRGASSASTRRRYGSTTARTCRVRCVRGCVSESETTYIRHWRRSTRRCPEQPNRSRCRLEGTTVDPLLTAARGGLCGSNFTARHTPSMRPAWRRVCCSTEVHGDPMHWLISHTGRGSPALGSPTDAMLSPFPRAGPPDGASRRAAWAPYVARLLNRGYDCVRTPPRLPAETRTAVA